MQKFKIFYSWQSDLPSDRTRNFIRKCIDEAIELAEESETIEAERDEATKGITGSPNIVTTLFSKIDECDLFIADLSLCYTENLNKEKKSPNPNVLLELGYAAKTLGWERVICLCNTDYGDEYPFDVSHNRITTYSLEGKNKREVSGDIAKIIFINIRDIRKLKPRTRSGVANHIVGTYDYESQTVVDKLVAIEIENQEGYVLHNKALLKEAAVLFEECKQLTSKMTQGDKEDGKCKTGALEQVPLESIDDSLSKLTKAFKDSEIPVVWQDAELDADRIKRWIDVDVPKNFFDVGNLKRVVQAFNLLATSPKLVGSNEEKVKYEKLQELSHVLSLLDTRNNYVKTFDGMCFIPLAIQNISSLPDQNIRVVVNVESGTIVEPNEHLIWSEYEGLQGHFCRDDDDENDVGVICELFCLNEDGNIHIEDIPYNPDRFIPRMPVITSNGLSQPSKTDKDYALELQEFVASTNGDNYYEFEVESLRPGECKWLCCGLLIKPHGDNIKLNYQIHSIHSLGDLKGTLEIQQYKEN